MSSAARANPVLSVSGFWLLFALLILGLAAAAWALNPSTVLITRSFDGSPTVQAASAVQPSVSADGRYVAFADDAINFGTVLPRALNIFVKHTETGALELVSVATDGTPANGGCLTPSISADGRFVAFRSNSSNLVANDTNSAVATYDIFVRDRQLGTTDRVNVGPNGVEANGDSEHPSISADGRFVAFDSQATNLVAGVSNTGREVYVRDRRNGTTDRVSTNGSSRRQRWSDSPSISADGHFVAYRSELTEVNFQGNIFVRDMQDGTTALIDVGFQREQGSEAPFISPDASYVVFDSGGRNLLPTDTYNRRDVFLWTRSTWATERISLREGGIQAGSFNQKPSVSADGRYVAFQSFADGPNPGSADGATHLFLRDRQAGVTTQIIPGTGRKPGSDSTYIPVIANDGRSIVFPSDEDSLDPEDTNHRHDVFQYQRESGATHRVSVGAAGEEGVTRAISEGLAVSADGRFVAFQSFARNLLPGESNDYGDIFVKNRVTGALELISVSSTETPGDDDSWRFVSINADGRYVAFSSNASNLVPGDTNGMPDVFVRDRRWGTTSRASMGAGGVEANGWSEYPSISADGRYVAFQSTASNFPGVNQNDFQIFLRDRVLGTTILVSRDAQGTPGNSSSFLPSISKDGRYIAFYSLARNLVAGDTNREADTFVWDRQQGTTERVSVGAGGVQGNGASYVPAISGNGRYVTFSSLASNLAPGDTNGTYDVFVRDRQQGTTERVSVAKNGAGGNGLSYFPSINEDGRYVAFYSEASNLVPGDTNGVLDVFLRDRQQGTIQRVSLGKGGVQANAPSDITSLSADGRFLAFRSAATNLVSEPTNGSMNVYLADRQSAPRQLRATTLPNLSIRLDWEDTREDEVSFYIQRSTGAGPWVSVAGLPPNTFSYVNVGLTANTSYTYRVRSNGASGNSAFSEEATATTRGNPPAAPSGLTVTVKSQTRIDLAWADGSADESGFKIERRKGFGAYGQIGVTRANVSAYPDAVGLTANTAYTYRVRSYSPNGDSTYSNGASTTTLPNAPAAPSALAAVVVSQTRVDLKWQDKSANEEGFRVERKSGAGGYIPVKQLPAGSTFWSDTGVVAASSYTYRAFAYNRGGDSAASNAASALTPPNPPTAPSNLTAKALSDIRIQLDWRDNSTSEVGFRLERRIGNTAFALLASPVAGSVSYTDTALTPNTTAVYRIRAYNTGGESANSSEATAKTLPKVGGQLVVSPLKINFGKVKLKKQKLATVTIRNGSGTERLRITVTAPPAPFALQTAVGTVELAPGARTSVGVLFAPRKTKKVTGNLSISSSDPAKPVVKVRLAGSGKK